MTKAKEALFVKCFYEDKPCSDTIFAIYSDFSGGQKFWKAEKGWYGVFFVLFATVLRINLILTSPRYNIPNERIYYADNRKIQYKTNDRQTA